MKFREIITMALASLGANKLRSAPDHDGDHDRRLFRDLGDDGDRRDAGVNRTGMSSLGSNIFQFAKYPVSVNAGRQGLGKI